MNLEEVLRKAVERINSGSLVNEAQVKQAVILPILRELDWDDSNPDEFVPELAVPEGRVDYALLRAPDNPLVFIESKYLERIGTGEEQLFRYAVNKGVPFLILTDGNLWDFYLSMAAGIPAERRFYRAELTRDERMSEYVEFFEKFLRKNRVISQEARREAEQRHESNLERVKARDAIPRVWRTLVESSDEELYERIVSEVESECGTRPELDDVEVFLSNLLVDAPSQTPEVSSTTPHPHSSISDSSLPQPPDKSRLKIVGFILNNNPVETGAANRTLAEALKRFQLIDPGFMSRFEAKTKSRRRRLVAKNRDELYNQPHLITYSLDLENGWWLGTNISSDKVRTSIQIACEVAGVKFGTQLTLIER
ncbi:MAG: hypothetical protein F4X91_09885 [Nitrospinae bacterium]|nr:hypothetical protein [Nitrospinota bacterium]